MIVTKKAIERLPADIELSLAMIAFASDEKIITRPRVEFVVSGATKIDDAVDACLQDKSIQDSHLRLLTLHGQSYCIDSNEAPTMIKSGVARRFFARFVTVDNENPNATPIASVSSVGINDLPFAVVTLLDIARRDLRVQTSVGSFDAHYGDDVDRIREKYGLAQSQFTSSSAQGFVA